MGRILLIILFILLPLLLLPAGDISSIPAAQILIDQGEEALSAGDYEEALQYFIQAGTLDVENRVILDYIDSLNRIVSLNDYQSDEESIDEYLRDSDERSSREENSLGEEQTDFISREKNKERARLERTRGDIYFYYPFFNSSDSSSDTDNKIGTTGNMLRGLSYSFSYFPDFINRIIGIEGGTFCYSLTPDGTVNIYEEAYFGFVLKNYFNEQPGVFSLFGTNISGSLVFDENVETEASRMFPAWHIEFFFRDPLLYRLNRTEFNQALAFTANLHFSLREDTYMISYGGGLDLGMGDFSLLGEYTYRNLLLQDAFTSSWMITIGLKYSFR